MTKYNLPKGYRVLKKMKSGDNYGGFYIIAYKDEDVLFLIFDGISNNPIYLKKYKTINL